MLRSREGSELITIGALSARSGVPVSAIRFYESQGLLPAQRSGSGHRRFTRESLRRLAFIRVTQSLGYTLDEIRGCLGSLPDNRTPTKSDWMKLAKGFQADIQSRIEGLQLLQQKLTGCIGCGCLSLKSCKLYNPNDQAAAKGNGPRYLLGDEPPSH